MSLDGSDSGSVTDMLQRQQSRLINLLNIRKPRTPEPQNQRDALMQAKRMSPSPASMHGEDRLRKLEELRAFERLVNMRRRMSAANAADTETPEQRSRYGEWDVYHVETEPWAQIRDIATVSRAASYDEQKIAKFFGTEWRFRARIHAMRHMSSHLAFVVLREHGVTLQAVLSENGTGITPHMMHWVMRLPTESLVLVRGTLEKPRDMITGCDIAHLELHPVSYTHLRAHET